MRVVKLNKKSRLQTFCKALKEKEKELQDAFLMLDTLRTVLNTAYEGVVVVDGNGTIREFNKAYSEFIGVSRDAAIGKHVSEVIENTRLHLTVKSGIPERGSIQTILGQEMVVHRMPIWRDGNVVGAIGMIIFQGVSEVYNILNRVQSLSRTVPQTEKAEPKEQPAVKTPFGVDGIVGRSQEISKIKRIALRAAKVPSTVLITGESGTGKEVFAKAIHKESLYSGGNFVGVNCAAIPEHLLEAELFGYEEGSFTGAKKGGKIGKFELAHHGTMFLDEIGDMPLYMQAKILRVLEERVVERVGGLSTKEVDVRIIAATNKDLEQMVAEGKFREDLFFRLNIIRIQIPSLKERVQDIPYLVSYHLDRLCREFRMEPKQFSKDVMNLFMNYSWPGNIRELVNTLEMLIGLVDDDTIRLEHLPAHFFYQQQRPVTQTEEHFKSDSPLKDTWKDTVFEQEKRALHQALIEEKGNKAAVARKLGIHRSTLYEKLKKYQLT